MSDDPKFDSFLRQNGLRSPARPASEWQLIQAKIQAGDWRQILSNSVRAFDFWAPSLAMSTLALIGITMFTKMEEMPATTDAVSRVSEIFTTDLVSSTAYDANILD